MKASEVQAGEMVTTVSNLDGVGIGYLVDGVAWVTTGNGFAINAKDNVGGLKSYKRDGGETYRRAVEKLAGAGRKWATPEYMKKCCHWH